MKVYDQKLSGAASSGAAQTQETQRAGRGTESRSGRAGSGGDVVELSGALGSLSRAMSSFHSGAAERVQALAAQYRAGSYRPDAAATSRAMVSDAVAAAAK
jgi:hypothetical protein